MIYVQHKNTLTLEIFFNKPSKAVPTVRQHCLRMSL